MRSGRVRRLRDLLGLTQTELGYVVGAHWVTVNRWERGHVKPGPSADQVLGALWNVAHWRPDAVARFIGADSLQTWLERALREALPPEWT